MSFYRELRRRHVFKVAAGYAVVAWLLIQVASVISGPMALPQWFEPLVLSLLLLGFPIALVLAWAFDLQPAVEGVRSSDTSPATSAPAYLPKFASGLIGAIVLVAIAVGGWWYSGADERRARSEGIAELDKLIDAGEWHDAYLLARELDTLIPDDDELAGRWPKFSFRTTLESEPDGARVSLRAYRDADDRWQPLGSTPLIDVRVPFGVSVVRAELPDLAPVLQVIGSHLYLTETLTTTMYASKVFVLAPEVMKMDPAGSLPDGMVRVAGWRKEIDGAVVHFDDFFLDRYEVTNQDYREFIDAGGYERRELWEHPVVKDGEEITWEAAMAGFTDSTGQPGPSTWLAGDYPDGERDHPVGGISWYEAAAYARFRGKQLPSMHHWLRAYAGAALAFMVPESNLDSASTVAAGSTNSLSWAGNFDMAGNVREWAFNAVGDRRSLLGGAWNDDPYRASDFEFSQRPIDRDAGNGIRLAIVRDSPQTLEKANRPVTFGRQRDFPTESSVPDEVFQAYRINFDYDPTPMNATVTTISTDRLMKHDLVEIDAAYPSLRLPIHLYLPENAAPPYQVVVYWPGSIVQRLAHFDDFRIQFEFVLKSGRAVALPVFYSSFGRVAARQAVDVTGTAAERDLHIRTIKDLRRTVDYLETRPDIDVGKIAFFGNSWGGNSGVIGLAVDKRFRTSILYTMPVLARSSPDVDAINYLSRVTTPVLVIGGEFDPIAPLDSITRPAFDVIGTPETDKRLVTAPGGHSVPYDLLVRESLAWLDQYLGPPRRR